jgi:hypothetical protein
VCALRLSVLAFAADKASFKKGASEDASSKQKRKNNEFAEAK